MQNGFLEGLRGKGGGYRLTRSPDQYTVGEILMLTEGSLAPVSCLTPNATPCSRMANCRTYEMWKGLDDLIPIISAISHWPISPGLIRPGMIM